MSTKTASIISTVVTGLLVFPLMTLFFGAGLLLLNGYMSADTAVFTGMACLSLTFLLCPIIAWNLTKFFSARFNWNNFISISASVIASSLISVMMGFGTMFVMAIVAETMRKL